MQRCVIAIIVASYCQRASADLKLVQKASQLLSESERLRAATRRRKPYDPQASAVLSQCKEACVPNCCQACPSVKSTEVNGPNMTVEVDFKDCKQKGTLSWAVAKTTRGFEGLIQNFDIDKSATFNVPVDKYLHLQVGDESFWVNGDDDMCDSGTQGYGQKRYWASDCTGRCGEESQSSACDVPLYIGLQTTTTTTATTTTKTTTPTTTTRRTKKAKATTTEERSTTTTTSCETTSCEIYNDPHVSGFDNSEDDGPASLGHLPFLVSIGSTHPIYYGAGDMWLVKSDSVHIQGRYVSSTAFKTGGAVMGAIAISGPILDGKVLLVEPRGGSVTLDGYEVSVGNSETDLSSGQVRVQNNDRIFKKNRPFTRTEVQLPMHTGLSVNRYDEFINVKITMPKIGLGRIEGQCRNSNGDVEDDSSASTESRMDSSAVLPEESLFEHHRTSHHRH